MSFLKNIFIFFLLCNIFGAASGISFTIYPDKQPTADEYPLNAAAVTANEVLLNQYYFSSGSTTIGEHRFGLPVSVNTDVNYF